MNTATAARPVATVLTSLALVVAVAACSDADQSHICGDSAEPQVIAPVADWSHVEPEADPFLANYDGDATACAATSHGVEEGVQGEWWEIETVRCGYLTIAQPTAVDACAGAEVRVRLWHFNLLDTGADFDVAVAFGERAEVIRETIPVPADSELLEFTAVLDEDIPKGELLYFHLSNHGSNTWGLMDTEIRPSQ